MAQRVSGSTTTHSSSRGPPTRGWLQAKSYQVLTVVDSADVGVICFADGFSGVGRRGDGVVGGLMAVAWVVRRVTAVRGRDWARISALVRSAAGLR